jgi:Flp pilus assembly protein TadB
MGAMLLIAAIWVGLDALLIVAWCLVRARRQRHEVRGLIREAERVAGAARPLAAALNSGHAEDPAIRHPLGLGEEAAQGRLRPL